MGLPDSHPAVGTAGGLRWTEEGTGQGWRGSRPDPAPEPALIVLLPPMAQTRPCAHARCGPASNSVYRRWFWWGLSPGGPSGLSQRCSSGAIGAALEATGCRQTARSSPQCSSPALWAEGRAGR